MAVAQWKIGGSVGSWGIKVKNKEADVKTIQEMLRNASMILNAPEVDPGNLDGQISKNSAKSGTVKAIKAFQSRFIAAPDGVIDVGGRTWKELMTVLESGGHTNLQPEGLTESGGFFFPFAMVPSVNWTSAPRSFGSRRSKGKRAHAGCDLYAPVGTKIYSIASGIVSPRGVYPFYAGTFAIEIDHGSFLARYGEVQGSAPVKAGDHVKAGQEIAKVGKLVGLNLSMLHLELYDNSGVGPLSVGASQGAKTSGGIPYFRRKDLIDPTPKLNEWKKNLP